MRSGSDVAERTHLWREPIGGADELATCRIPLQAVEEGEATLCPREKRDLERQSATKR
jgi:hypothetical protein